MPVLNVVGRARTPVRHPERVPTQGLPGRIEVVESCRPALLGLEAASHLVVISWLEHADRGRLRLPPRAEGGEARGVFAVRSPARPNPIGLSTSRIVRVDEDAVHLERLDLWDGTPILDLKPYSPGWDVVLWATHTRRTRPWRLPPEELDALLEREALDATGRLDPIAREVIEALRTLILSEQDPRDPARTYTIPTLDARVDLLAVMTGATFGNGRLRYDPAVSEPFET